MRPCLSIVAFCFSVGAAMAEDLPAPVQKAIAENKSSCKTVAIEKGFVTRKDINGDGRPDFILDYSYFFCDGHQRPICGSIGCTIQVFASLPNGSYAKVLDDNVKRIDFREVRGRPAMVVGLRGDADPCRKDPADLCEVVKSWNGSSFVDTPAANSSNPAGVVSAAAPVSATTPSATGWEFTYFSGPARLVEFSPRSGHAKVWLLCQPSPRATELRIDPGTDDQNTQEGKRSLFLIEIQTPSGSLQKFPLVAYNFGPDGGSQFYSRNFVSSSFLDAFGQEGGVLRWRTAKGAELASWPLTGTAAAREMVRKVCNL